LDAILDALVGGVEHRVALIGFDSQPHLVTSFTPDTAVASRQLASLREGEAGGAILDGVAFAIEQLQTQPAGYRRAILLLSETIDHGSKANLGDTLRLISDTNTTMYSFGFSSTTSAVSHEASKFGTVGIFGAEFGSSEPGPANGCFSRERADAAYQGHYDNRWSTASASLPRRFGWPPMAFLAARNVLRTNAAEAVAQLTGGEFFQFHEAKDLKNALIAISNDVPNSRKSSGSQPSMQAGSITGPIPALHRGTRCESAASSHAPPRRPRQLNKGDLLWVLDWVRTRGFAEEACCDIWCSPLRLLANRAGASRRSFERDTAPGVTTVPALGAARVLPGVANGPAARTI
jgi:hypothetical protein